MGPTTGKTWENPMKALADGLVRVGAAYCRSRGCGECPAGAGHGVDVKWRGNMKPE